MNVTRANFGASTSPHGSATTDDVIVFGTDKYSILDPDGSLRDVPPGVSAWNRAAPGRGPFDIADFGTCDRLSWQAGACSIRKDPKLTFWGDRYACWFDDRRVVIADATRTQLVELHAPDLLDIYVSFLIHGDAMWLNTTHGVTRIELRAIEALFEQPTGAFEIHVREAYPLRATKRRERARIEAIADGYARARILDDLRSSRFPAVPGLELDMEITLCDQLWRDLYLEIEVPGQPRRTLYKVVNERVINATLARSPAIDPAGSLARSTDPPSRQADLDRLFQELAAAPDDVDGRSILVDMLEDAGEPYAPALAVLVAGETDEDLRRQALGTLASYFAKVEYRGGLPWSATLSHAAPLDQAIGDVVAADQRLGLFHELRLGEGPFDVYAKLVGSPRAVGLRRVDVSHRPILEALVGANRRTLTHLYNVKFTTRPMIELLAHPTFDRARELWLETTAAFAARLLEFVARDELHLFTRAPRHVVLAERAGRDSDLVATVLAAWDSLPVAALTVAGVTLTRDGARTTASAPARASAKAIGQIRARFPIEEAP